MTTPDTARAGQEALETLRLMLQDEEVTDASRVSAARALLDRFVPKDEAERERREAEERAAALAEARCLLAEFAATRLARLHAPDAVAEDGAAGASDAAG